MVQITSSTIVKMIGWTLSKSSPMVGVRTSCTIRWALRRSLPSESVLGARFLTYWRCMYAWYPAAHAAR